MLQEDSNGENFEIIDRKTEELSIAESMSSMSSSASLLPSPGAVVIPAVSAGNLLSNVQPPSALPSFITQTPIVSPVQAPSQIPHKETAVPSIEPYLPTQFCAAIPPSKGIKHGPAGVQQEEASRAVPPQALPVGDATGGFMDWMKGAVASGGILSKVAEKAKSSVDSMITTLDPQMKELIYTGGDVEVLVASEQEVKVSAVREAFQSVFGKARVEGIVAQSLSVAAQPVGFAAGVKAAEERIQAVLSNPKLQSPLPVVAIENFLLEVGEDRWFDLGVVILNDPVKQINLQTFTQMTPVPAEIVNLAQEDTPADYPLKWSGLSIPIGGLMASNLHVSPKEWHFALTGVSRRDLILSAAKTLANLYKNSS